MSNESPSSSSQQQQQQQQAAGGGGANTPWGWLGLLKWSLAYSDGTSPTSHSPMTDEDKEFLEKVMKEGIIDENERMKEILQQVTKGLEQLQQQQQVQVEQDEKMEDLLQELRDIVEQIDYARAFAAMKGLDFLLGCVAQKEIPQQIQIHCLGIIATMASNNPPIQKQLLEMAAIKTLMDVFFSSSASEASIFKFRAKIIQALSAIVRSYDLAEQVFCGLEESATKRIMLEGLLLGDDNDNDNDNDNNATAAREALQKRTLFFLRALITSDDSNRQRVQLFAHSVAYVADHYLVMMKNNNSSRIIINAEIREMAIALLVGILEQKHSVNTILDRKDQLVAAGVQQVSTLRALSTQEERDYASVELELWESLLVLLARATPDLEEEQTTTPLMIEASKPEVEPQ